jgi:hypothetical protein
MKMLYKDKTIYYDRCFPNCKIICCPRCGSNQIVDLESIYNPKRFFNYFNSSKNQTICLKEEKSLVIQGGIKKRKGSIKMNIPMIKFICKGILKFEAIKYNYFYIYREEIEKKIVLISLLINDFNEDIIFNFACSIFNHFIHLYLFYEICSLAVLREKTRSERWEDVEKYNLMIFSVADSFKLQKQKMIY